MKLSKRQLQILKLIQEGKSNQEISQNLTISEGTVKQHLFQLYKKLNVKNRTQALVKYQNVLKDINEIPNTTAKEKKQENINKKHIWRLISSLAIIPNLDHIEKNTTSIININHQINLLKNEIEILGSIFDGKLIAIPGVGFILLFGFPQDHADDNHRSIIVADYIINWVKNNIEIPIKCGVATLPEVFIQENNIVFKAESLEQSIKLAKLADIYSIHVNEIAYQFTKSLYYFTESIITDDHEKIIYRKLTHEITKYKNHCYFDDANKIIEKLTSSTYSLIKLYSLDHTEIVLIQDLLQNIINDKDNFCCIRISLPYIKNEELFYKSLLGQILINNYIHNNPIYINVLRSKEITSKNKIMKIIGLLSHSTKLVFNLIGFNTEFETSKLLELIDFKDSSSCGVCILSTEIDKYTKNKIKIKSSIYQNNEWVNCKSYSFNIFEYNKNVKHFHAELSRIVIGLTNKSIEVLTRLSQNRIIYISQITDSLNELLNTNLVTVEGNQLMLKNKKTADIIKEIIFNPDIN